MSNQVVEIAMTIPGKTRKGEIDLLYKCALQCVVPGPIVEIGTYYGRCTFVLAATGRQVHSIDNYKEGPRASEPDYGVKPNLMRVYAEWPEDQFPFNVCLIEGDSAQCAEGYSVGEIAMLFIDGGHTAPQIDADCCAWLKRVRKGGLAAFHDYGNPNWPDVKPTVDAHLGDEWTKIDQFKWLAVFERGQSG